MVLYLLLRRHHDIMRLAQSVIVHPEEFPDAAATVTLVQDAIFYRSQNLRGIFPRTLDRSSHLHWGAAGLLAQRRLNVDFELEEFACAMVRRILCVLCGNLLTTIVL